MSIRERAKKIKEKSEEDEEIELGESSELKEPQASQLPVQEIKQEKISQAVALSQKEQFLQALPKWVSKPWMYVQPTHPNQLTSWIDGWKRIILDYCRIFVKHIINLAEIQTIYPFQNPTNGKSLSLSQLETIVDKMVEEGLAKWINNKKLLVRIYYKPIEQWADEIYTYLMETGRAAEILTLMEFRQMPTEWKNLPDEDLMTILSTYVQQGKAKFVTKEKDAVEFIF